MYVTIFVGYELDNNANTVADDELIYIPGRWKYPDGSSGFRITRIYVSSKASTENGAPLSDTLCGKNQAFLIASDRS